MTVRNEKSRPAATGTALKQNRQTHDNSASAQRNRLLEALSRRPISTIEARRDLDILHPAGRVKELRHNEGHQILTAWSYEPTDCGKLHRVARYVLVKRGAA